MWIENHVLKCITSSVLNFLQDFPKKGLLVVIPISSVKNKDHAEKVSNLLLTWKANLILNECPPVIVSQDGKLPAATLKWDLHPHRDYQFWECTARPRESQRQANWESSEIKAMHGRWTCMVTEEGFDNLTEGGGTTEIDNFCTIKTEYSFVFFLYNFYWTHANSYTFYRSGMIN